MSRIKQRSSGPTFFTKRLYGFGHETMYPDLTTLLNVNLDDLAKGQFILIEDSKTDGSFILHHFLSSFLKGDGNVCLVGFSQTLVHYSSIGKKLGLNLNVAKDSNQLVFIDGMEIFLKCLQSEDSLESSVKAFDLKSLYDNLVSHLPGTINKPTLLVLDDISTLINAGFSAEKVADFMHYCNCLATTMEKPICLLALLHCDSDVEDDDAIFLRNQLKYHATIQMSVRGLETGYSRDVHGEIEVKQRNAEHIDVVIPETKKMQYKLNDKGVSFFPLGTSSAVL